MRGAREPAPKDLESGRKIAVFPDFAWTRSKHSSGRILIPSGPSTRASLIKVLFDALQVWMKLRIIGTE